MAEGNRDHAPPSAALTEAFADYETQLLRTADKRLKGRQSAIRYNRRRFLHALKRLQNAKIVLKDANENCPIVDATAPTVGSVTKDDEVEIATITTTVSFSPASRDGCLNRLRSVANKTTRMRKNLNDLKDAEELLAKIRKDPRHQKTNVSVDDIVKQLEDIDKESRPRINTITMAKT